MAENHDMFLDGNELIEAAIREYRADGSKEHLIAVLDALRQRMHADGHFILPILVDENDESKFAFRTIQTRDGKMWNAAFTSMAEYEQGAPSQVLSHFIDSIMKACLGSDAAGIILNPWGQSFMLTRDLMEAIFRADGDVEYIVPDDPITPELLEDGSFLKRATEICSRNRTQLNMIKLARILRDSVVWIPCNAILSDADYEVMEKEVLAASNGEGLDSLIGKTFTNKDEVRLVPDILQNGDDYFFPVFTTEEEMGEYGTHFSKVPGHFLKVVNLTRNNEKDVAGIVINAFSEPFVITMEMAELIETMESSFPGEESS